MFTGKGAYTIKCPFVGSMKNLKISISVHRHTHTIHRGARPCVSTSDAIVSPVFPRGNAPTPNSLARQDKVFYQCHCIITPIIHKFTHGWELCVGMVFIIQFMMFIVTLFGVRYSICDVWGRLFDSSIGFTPYPGKCRPYRAGDG